MQPRKFRLSIGLGAFILEGCQLPNVVARRLGGVVPEKDQLVILRVHLLSEI